MTSEKSGTPIVIGDIRRSVETSEALGKEFSGAVSGEARQAGDVTCQW